ncbi:MAG TPA: hypothetical protein PKC68_06925 [Alphaproteobacteria bacterium]|jgi:hypothetical protein|nr:hypothetical protein [Alphaproteobacteria bacterium]
MVDKGVVFSLAQRMFSIVFSADKYPQILSHVPEHLAKHNNPYCGQWFASFTNRSLISMDNRTTNTIFLPHLYNLVVNI